MWIYNTVTEKWERETDTLSKDNYDSLKVDLEKVKLYSRALSGATYLPISNIDNIYDALSYKDTNTWYIDPASSIYNATTGLPSNGNPINKDTISTYQKYKHENGFTLKNAFTPDKGIEEINYISADIATTTEIDVNAVLYTLDGITLVEGQTVLVKDQISTVDLAFTVDPNSYFVGNYYLQTENVSDNTYYFYNSENGIYTYINNRLVKQTLATYSLSSNLTILVKLGTYADKQFALSRKLDGYYPVEGEPFEFKLSHNYLVRHRVDYHNLYENNYYDILKHSEQILNIDGFTYTVPERSLYIGDFGVILVNQDFVKSEYVYNVYKSNLKSITQTSQWYWMCGEEGTIIKMSKIDFSITKIDLGDEFKTLTSISFINDNRGIVVGKYNTIYYTIDGGWNWKKLEFDSIQSYSYNKVVYYSETTAYIGGENGIFLQLDYSDTYGWSLTQINISKDLTVTDQYDLIEDIQDMYYTRFNTWGLSYSTATSSSISTIKDCLFIVSNNGNIIVYDINNFINHDFLYLSFSQSLGDLTSITRQFGTDNIIVSGDSTISFDINVFNSVSTTSNLIIGSSYTTLYTDYNNKIFDYNGNTLFAVGNYSLASEYIYFTEDYIYIESYDSKPRMLFMDYDLADKLNFFDANYDYRLPNSITFSSINLNNVSFNSYQNTWIDYLNDVLKTYPAVGADTTTGNQVKPNLIFSAPEASVGSYKTFSSSDITLNYSDIKGLYPNVGIKDASRWATFTPIIPTSAYSVFMNRYMSIFKLPYNFCSPGDILRITSDTVEADLMINFGLTTSTTTSGVILSSTVSSGGTGYAIGNTFSINTGNSLAIGRITGVTGGGVAGGDIYSFGTIINGGSGYTVGDTFTVNGGTGGIGRVTSVGISTTLGGSLIVGTSSGYAGYVNGPALTSKFNNINKIRWYSNCFYICDTDNHAIRKYSFSTGQVTTIAGDGTSGFSGDGFPATAAKLNSPTSIAIDSLGNIYIADYGNTRIRKIDVATGNINTVASVNCYDICVDNSDNVYFTDDGTNRVKKINTSGAISIFAGTSLPGYSGDGGSATSARIDVTAFSKIDCDGSGNVYFYEYNNNRIRKVDASTGIITTFLGNGVNGQTGAVFQNNLALGVITALGLIFDIYIDKVNNNMYFVNSTYFTGYIVNYNLTTSTFTYQSWNLSDYLSGITVDPTGAIYYSASNRIRNLTTIILASGVVTSAIVNSPGSSYPATSNATTTSTTGSGLVIRTNANPTYSLPSGIVTSYSISNFGTGYVAGLRPTTNIVGSGTGFVVNILVATPLITSTTYFYAFNDFNTSILNSIKNSNTGITITNLNRFENSSVLLTNFENHPLSQGYKLSYNSNLFTLEPRFNNYTAYKSLETSVSVINNTTTTNFDLNYANTFNLFGYTPKYSILNYLNTINSTFTASKVFPTMPKYVGLPLNSSGNFTANNIYYDSNTTGTASYPKNKLIFGDNFKFEYDSLWINTFVDLNLYTSGGNFAKTKVLITNKYYDSIYNGWAIEFHDSINKTDDGTTYANTSFNSIDILSRNTLQQISDDLDLFNNLNKPLIDKKYNTGLWYITTYDNPIKSKINTDSYTKILLSDGDIKRYLSSIIYTDSENRLSMDVINVSKLLQFNINDTFNYTGNLGIYTPNILDLEGSILASTKFIGGSGSSEYLNPSYVGIHTLTKIDDNNLYANTPYLNITSVADIGTINYYKFDPFFNYSPISLWDIGIDKMYKIPLELFETNLSQTGNTFSLINTDKNDYIFRLIDGLDINQIANKYHWIVEAEISDAIIGQDNNGIVWYKGIWHSGRWFGGTWQSGTWITGDWYNGNWYSNEVTDKINYVEVGSYNISPSNSEWYNGRWYEGSWYNGNWYNGRLYGVTWSNGNWYNGIWNDGYWKNGLFAGGIWVQGTWDSGTFNSSNKPAFWINGKFLSGDFQNGMWYNGIFGQNFNVISKFGSKATNSRNATWQGGVWASGNFYSYENIDLTGKILPSLIQKYSIWKTGTWNQGNFYGGIVYNIEYLNGHWYTGITKDIQIIGINVTNNEITLNGIFRFNINDYINIINNDNTTPFSSVGSDSKPGRYRIALVRYDLTNNWTTLTLDYNFNLFAFDAPYKKPGGFYVGVTGLDPFGGITLYSTAVGQNGRNYSVGSTFSVVGGSTTAIGSITAVDTNGAVTSFNIITPGTGYSLGNYTTLTSGSMSVSNADTKLKAVSLFKNVTWDSGVFGNGIVESGTFYGCIWYNGIFNGTWGI